MDPDRKTVIEVESLGEVTFPTGFLIEDTEVGGLSGITYDTKRDIYYALSDDRSDTRFYTVSIAIADGKLSEDDVEFVNVTTLTDPYGMPFAEASIDPEGIACTRLGQLYISSEGDANRAPGPFCQQVYPQGTPNQSVTDNNRYR